MLRSITAALLWAVSVAFAVDGQTGAPAPAVAAVPFGPGEKLNFKVSLSPFGGVGRGSLEVVDLDTIHGHPSYQLRMTLKGGIPFARVDDTMQSWLDAQRLVSRRFHQDQKEVRYERHRKFDFYPEERRWERTDKDENGELPTDMPLDDVSFLYYVRTLPLEVGRTYTLPRYFQQSGNPVVVKVVRRQQITVPAGTFETIVVQPVIQTRGLFGKGGKAEVYFTDDARRLVVQLKSDVPVLGSLNMYLESYESGTRLTPSATTTSR